MLNYYNFLFKCTAVKCNVVFFFVIIIIRRVLFYCDFFGKNQVSLSNYPISGRISLDVSAGECKCTVKVRGGEKKDSVSVINY